MAAHKKPLVFLLAWLLLETAPAFISPFLDDEIYSFVYFLTEDWAGVSLALAFYTGLSYTSTLLKLSAFMAVIVSSLFALSNLFIESLPDVWYPAFVLSCVAGALILSSVRFAFVPRKNITPRHDSLYLVVRKPSTPLDLIGLIYSGLGGGFAAYYNGAVWKFDRKTKKLIKKFDPTYYVGKRLIDYGSPMPGMISDLDQMVGTNWSVFNNCHSVFTSLGRKWGRDEHC